jgi:hypothetical protein
MSLLNIYIDDVIKHTRNSRYCCSLRFTCASTFKYADDLILMSSSVTVILIQTLFKIVAELMALEMSIDPSKWSCIRFGPLYEAMYENITAHDGSVILRVKSIKYLGIVQS